MRHFGTRGQRPKHILVEQEMTTKPSPGPVSSQPSAPKAEPASWAQAPPSRAFIELIRYDACPLCGSASFKDIRVGDASRHALYKPQLSAKLHWKQCDACAHIFRNGYYTDEALQLLFANAHANQQTGRDLERQRHVSARMIEKVLPYQSAGVWLDVGFGNGSLLFTAQEYGFDPLGLDLRQYNVDALKKFGIDALCQDITDLQLERKCSVISMADVLEHMPYPVEGLIAAHRLLEDGGVLFASMPNCDSVVWHALDAQKANPYWGEIEHYHNFSRTRLYALLAAQGFKPVRYGISERYRVCMEVAAIKIIR